VNLKARFALAWLGLLAGIALLIWVTLFLVLHAIPETERGRIVGTLEDPVGLGLLLFVGLFAITGFTARAFLFRYIAPPRRLIEGARIQLSANASHRVEPQGTPENRELGRIANTFAERYEDLKRDVGARIQEANAHLEEERNRLAALMSELTQSVLVCNVEGRILLYNQRAKQLLSARADGNGDPVATALVGLGRSIFGVIDRNLVSHALENVRHRIEQGDAHPIANFVATLPSAMQETAATLRALERRRLRRASPRSVMPRAYRKGVRKNSLSP
jgi:DNA polymerase-3 subunit epsilon